MISDASPVEEWLSFGPPSQSNFFDIVVIVVAAAWMVVGQNTLRD